MSIYHIQGVQSSYRSVVCAYVHKEIYLTTAPQAYPYTIDPSHAVLMTHALAYEPLGKQSGACGTPASAIYRRGGGGGQLL
jgi:hypothetical protein